MVALDIRWFHQYKKYGAFSIHEFLSIPTLHLELQKEKFLSNKVKNPVLKYDLQIDNIKEKRFHLTSLYKEIIHNEDNTYVKQAYIDAITNKLTQLDVVEAVFNGDTETFVAGVEKIYGKPDPKIFNYSYAQVIKKIKKRLKSENSAVVRQAEKVLSMLPEIVISRTISQPDPTIYKAIINETNRYLSYLQLPTCQDWLDAADIADVFSYALRKLRAYEWTVKVEASAKTWISVNNEKKLVRIPKTRVMKATTLPKLVIHEIGTHVARNLFGGGSRLLLLSLGLSGYEEGEEGVAKLREQAIEGKWIKYGRNTRYLAVGLIYGLDGKRRSFRELFEILKEMDILKRLAMGNDYEYAKYYAEQRAWKICMRLFRGTDGQQIGVCYTKDLIYRSGNMKIWELLHQHPVEMYRLNVGKYNPAMDEHRFLLDKLSIE